MNRNMRMEQAREMKFGSSARPGRNTARAERWNHFLIQNDDGLSSKEEKDSKGQQNREKWLKLR